MKRLIIILCLTISLAFGYFGAGLSDGFKFNFSLFNYYSLKNAYKFYDDGDYKAALKEFLHFAGNDNSDAQYNVGVMYGFGMGTSIDHKMAAKWYRLAADQGHSDAQAQLALLHYNGQGVPQNYQEAVKWMTLAAE